MNCYICNCQLSEYDYCTSCGADVKVYKKIIYTSNRLYNEGLEKAAVRDLSGAAKALRQSLKLNKKNTSARNLLGLVYFEMGEVVAALSEWVVSQNYRGEKNIASEYISMVHSNVAKMESISTGIKKYNMAYSYCNSDSKDLAVIQLKQVLGQNPNFMRAHQLLALLYLNDEKWEFAEREARRGLEIDRGNTFCQRYLAEAERMMDPEDVANSRSRNKRKDPVRIQDGNDFIIQPANIAEPRGGGITSILNILIGLIIGMAAIYFLVVPAKISEVTREATQAQRELGDQIDAKTQTIKDLESKLQTLKNENAGLNEAIEGYVGGDGTLGDTDNLIVAAKLYLSGAAAEEVGEKLETIGAPTEDVVRGEAFTELYDTLLSLVGGTMGPMLYSEGYSVYSTGDYEAAAILFERAFFYNNEDAESLYLEGNCYKMLGDSPRATAIYQELIERFPDSKRAAKAAQYINEMAVND